MMWDFERCVSVFKQEIGLLQKLSLVQDSVHKAVMEREWTDFEWKIAEINQLGAEFAVMDGERAGIFAALKEKFFTQEWLANDSEPSFYSLAAKLPPDECRELTGLFRELKMSTLKLKTQNDIFTNYLKEIKTITAAWLEAIIPARGGKLYTGKGRQASAELHSMVLNQRV
ncbi:MAG: hypothetical protein FWD78_15620 [Treponema sp.]|nr:hypothetical protein [Treponema sp.]